VAYGTWCARAYQAQSTEELLARRHLVFPPIAAVYLQQSPGKEAVRGAEPIFFITKTRLTTVSASGRKLGCKLLVRLDTPTPLLELVRGYLKSMSVGRQSNTPAS